MRRKRQTRQLALEIVQTFGFEGNRVQRVGGCVFFQSEELAVEVDYVCVGC